MDTVQNNLRTDWDYFMQHIDVIYRINFKCLFLGLR